LDGVTVKPEQSKLLEYIEGKKKFYLPLQKEVEELYVEFKEIDEITKGVYFSTNVAELNSWNVALSKKEFHTKKAIEIVETIHLLSSYSQKDFDFYTSVVSELPKGKDIKTVDDKNFIRIQKEFTSRVKDNEIVLSYTGNGFAVDSWMLTTQRLYIATVGYNLVDILAIVCIDNYLLVIAQPEDKKQAKRTYLINIGFDEPQLLNITKSLSAICHKYLEKNLPETSLKYLTYEYYFYNDIMPKLINKSQSYNLESVHDGTNTPIDYQIRKVSGRDTFIFRYITSTGAGNKGMALTDQGLFIEQPYDTNKTFLKWEQLVNADITVKKKGFFSKDEMIINGQTYSLGNSDAKTEDWVSFLRNMIAVYKLCIMNYQYFIQKIQSLPNFPSLKDNPSLQHIVYTPPQPSVPTTFQSISRVTERQGTVVKQKTGKGGLFSSFTSSFIRGSKSAFDIIKDVGNKASESVFSSSDVIKNTSVVDTDGEKICLKCGSSIAKDKLFCGNCGSKYVTIQKCPVCGTAIEEGKKFCGMCGAKVDAEQARFCTNCGSKLADGVKFCSNCGAKV